METILCEIKIKDNHNAFYFGDSPKKQCPKKAVMKFGKLNVCEHHFNKLTKKDQKNRERQKTK